MYDLEEIVMTYAEYRANGSDFNVAIRWLHTDANEQVTADGALLYRCIKALYLNFDRLLGEVDFQICRVTLRNGERSLLVSGSYLQ